MLKSYDEYKRFFWKIAGICLHRFYRSKTHWSCLCKEFLLTILVQIQRVLNYNNMKKERSRNHPMGASNSHMVCNGIIEFLTTGSLWREEISKVTEIFFTFYLYRFHHFQFKLSFHEANLNLNPALSLIPKQKSSYGLWVFFLKKGSEFSWNKWVSVYPSPRENRGWQCKLGLWWGLKMTNTPKLWVEISYMRAKWWPSQEYCFSFAG